MAINCDIHKIGTFKHGYRHSTYGGINNIKTSRITVTYKKNIHRSITKFEKKYTSNI